jgi:hypothetical protein
MRFSLRTIATSLAAALFAAACSGDLVGLLPLRSSLTATVGADVTLAFSVTNDTPSPVTMGFRSSQQYDFSVRSSDTGTLLWRWSDGRMFTAALGSRTLAPGETVTYTEKWTPPGRGSYVAEATLTSDSHAAQAVTQFTVP